MGLTFSNSYDIFHLISFKHNVWNIFGHFERGWIKNQLHKIYTTKKFQKIPLSLFTSPLQKGTLGFSIYLNSWKKYYANTCVYKMQLKYYFPNFKK